MIEQLDSRTFLPSINGAILEDILALNQFNVEFLCSGNTRDCVSSERCSKFLCISLRNDYELKKRSSSPTILDNKFERASLRAICPAISID
ncbi:hypothetical protein WN51_00345 [Melipona quadrifasciata]|uniref:Uncharacterized protein n=1 Tax=Melipona quadrifasciata TaxID=166423 RepID=A0A0N0BFE7_9HYME|nr:hypothetical protein WN51_00345 [Melipona quadrifasciata]